MKKTRQIYLCILLLFTFCATSRASHVKGGWIGYKYLGEGRQINTAIYEVTLYLYIDCHNAGGSTEFVRLGAFDIGSRRQMANELISANKPALMRKSTFSPCIINKPEICYNVYTYSTKLELPINKDGYYLNVQFYARVYGVLNISKSDEAGISFSTTIPGSTSVQTENATTTPPLNNSPIFDFLDTSAICHNSKFTLPFTAKDPDGDSLSYYLDYGQDISIKDDNGQVRTDPTFPPYPSLDYKPPYSGKFPLGALVSIDPKTGIISGVAPNDVGEYVVAVYVQEWRNGILINTTKKELQVYVTNCTQPSASLYPTYINCKNNSFSFKNNSSILHNTYLWDFGVPDNPSNQSTLQTPTFEYPAAGTYQIKLKVSLSKDCTDSTTSEVKVYPKFEPNYNITNNCITAASVFTDATTTTYGNVDSWLWKFGDNTTSTEQNPEHQFSQARDYTVSLKVSNDKGCIDSMSRIFKTYQTPQLNVAFTDSLMCNKDSILLIAHAKNIQSYQWSPVDNYILNPNSSTPTIFPKENTQYTVTAKNGDCIESTQVNINLLKQLTLVANDIYACIGDSATFNVTSQASQYQWKNMMGDDLLTSYTTSEPSLAPTGNNTYQLHVAYGKNCQLEKALQVYAAPYPTVKFQSKDTSICVGNSILLQTFGSSTDIFWKPTQQTGNSIYINPDKQTTFIVDGYDRNSYCVKHVQDTMIVRLVPKFHINLKRDTTIVWNQSLALKPTLDYPDRKYYYSWLPAPYIAYPDSAIGISKIPKGTTLQHYTLQMQDEYGCEASALSTVHIFQTATDIFVPTAFTPNGDGKNDVVKPILAGIKQFHYFKIFNRWGQLIYTTQTIGQGWNGDFNGQPQPSGSTYVYQVAGVDFNDKKIEKSGTIVLIR